MTWGAIGGAAIATVGGSMLSGGGGGATQTASKEPWAEAAPWLKENIQRGQQLQDYYAANPFSQQQTAAYGNMASTSDYVRQLIPSLLGQVGTQGGYNRSNPTARPQGYNFGPATAAPAGLLQSSGGGNPAASMPQGLLGASQLPAPAAAGPAMDDSAIWDAFQRIQQVKNREAEGA